MVSYNGLKNCLALQICCYIAVGSDAVIFPWRWFRPQHLVWDSGTGVLKFKIIQLPIRFICLLIMRRELLWFFQLYGLLRAESFAGDSDRAHYGHSRGIFTKLCGIFCEIYQKAAVSGQPIPNGQYKGAAKVLGFGRAQTFLRSFFHRWWKIILPPMGSECMTLVKDASLCACHRLLWVCEWRQTTCRAAGNGIFDRSRYFYLIMNMIVSKVFGILEKRMSYYRWEKKMSVYL